MLELELVWVLVWVLVLSSLLNGNLRSAFLRIDSQVGFFSPLLTLPLSPG